VRIVSEYDGRRIAEEYPDVFLRDFLSSRLIIARSSASGHPRDLDGVDLSARPPRFPAARNFEVKCLVCSRKRSSDRLSVSCFLGGNIGVQDIQYGRQTLGFRSQAQARKNEPYLMLATATAARGVSAGQTYAVSALVNFLRSLMNSLDSECDALKLFLENDSGRSC
jgi:hypothetical protein